VLPTFAYEHKVFVGPFSRRFPKAKVRAAVQGGGTRQYEAGSKAAPHALQRAPCCRPARMHAVARGVENSRLNPHLHSLPTHPPTPSTQVYTAPFQWSFPLNLPPQFFGIFPAGEVGEGDEMPWSDEIDHKLFLPPSIGEEACRWVELGVD